MAPNDTSHVFVTVGTTSFDDLIAEVLKESTLQTLSELGHRRILIQLGNGKCLPDCDPLSDDEDFSNPAWFRETDSVFVSGAVSVYWLRYRPSLAACLQHASLVISHAGAGSCLEALGQKKPLVVVTNPTLQGNHQTELADRLEELEHLLSCVPSDLSKTLQKAGGCELKEFEKGKPELFAEFVDSLVGFAK